MPVLGNYIRITIDPAAEIIYVPHSKTLRVISGTATELPASSGKSPKSSGAAKAYIFSPVTLKGIVKVRISAIITDPATGTETYITTPDRVMVFEPQIREALGGKMDLSGCYIKCSNEKSCGAVIYRKRSGNIEYLLVKNKRGGNWGFPKGHIEIGETEYDTAMREVKEETGLDIVPLNGFRVLSEYHPRGKIFKQVVFFLAEMPETGEIVPQQAEIDRYMWADYGLAMRTFRFNNDRNVLTKARDWLRTG